jgi:1,2-diacylglycerol 3-alpha-glucosyltransferase
MRICMFTDSFLPYCSGVTFSVLNQASELVKRGHDVCVFRPKPHKQDLDENTSLDMPPEVEIFDVPFSVGITKVPKLRVTLPSFISSLWRVRKWNPDVVHMSTEWGCGWEGLIASKLLRKPTVGTFHTFFADPGYLKSFGLPSFNFIQQFMWWYSVRFFNACRLVTSPSKSVKDALIAHGIRFDPIIIPNGIERPVRVDADQIMKKRNDFGIYGPSFVYCGRISPEKSLDVVLRAFAIVQKRRRRAKLVIIGDGPLKASLELQAVELGIQDNVLFLGHVSHERLIEENLLLLADTFVTASKTENQPMSILEAMSFGLPIVGPTAKGIPELIEDRVNGLLFKPDHHEEMARCMLVMANKRRQRKRMGHGALMFAAEYQMPQVVDQLEKVYQQAIAEGRPQRKDKNLDQAG